MMQPPCKNSMLYAPGRKEPSANPGKHSWRRPMIVMMVDVFKLFLEKSQGPSLKGSQMNNY